MRPITRRIIHALTFEGFGILLAGLWLSVVSGADAVGATGLAAVSSAVAVAWNLVFNTMWEAWERRRRRKGRGFCLRVVHALGFEGGLSLILVPVMAWWLDVSLLAALVYDAALVVFFLLYAFLFNLVFDRVFGLPASARH